ncbi:UDP-glucuronosyltransferase 2B10-like [Saccoglossus kowalevskii]
MNSFNEDGSRRTDNYVYDGVKFPWFVPRTSLEAMQSFEVRPDDVWICTYSKSAAMSNVACWDLFYLDDGPEAQTLSADLLIYGYHPSRSRTRNLAYIGAALIKHCHSVDVLTASTDKFNEEYTDLGLPTLEPVDINHDSKKIHSSDYECDMSPVEAIMDVIESNAAYCDTLLQHKEKIRDTMKSYDMAITDAACLWCMAILQYIDIPFVLVHMATVVGVTTDVTTPLSYYPIELASMMLTDKMTYFDRLQNVLWALFQKALMLCQRQNYPFEQAKMHLSVKDFTIDYVHPLVPNVIPIGLLSARPSNILPMELQEFMQSSGDEGVIVASLRTHSHPKTRLFLTHGGGSSYREAIYHGVPMVCIPLVFDQFDTAAKIKSKGLGSYVKMKSLNNKNLYEAMVEVLSNENNKIKKLSAIVRDVPMNAIETAVFWIEHVIKHGANILTIHRRHLSVTEYYFLDVIGVLVISICSAFWLSRQFMKLLTR